MANVAGRWPIRFERWYSALSSALFLRPSESYVEIDGDEVSVKMGWAFRAKFRRDAVRATRKLESSPISRGVHGFGGRWLVNGSGDGILVLELAPQSTARVMGIPVRLHELMVSVNDPDGLAAQLHAS
jgi:hypothetical protein